MKDIKIKKETKLVLGDNPVRFAKPDACSALKYAKCLSEDVCSVISPLNFCTYSGFDRTVFLPVALVIDASRVSDKKHSLKAVAENRRVL